MEVGYLENGFNFSFKILIKQKVTCSQMTCLEMRFLITFYQHHTVVSNGNVSHPMATAREILAAST